MVICTNSPDAWRQAFEIVRGGGQYQYRFRDWWGKDRRAIADSADWGGEDRRAIATAMGIGPTSRGGKIVIVASPPQGEWQPRVMHMKAISLMGNNVGSQWMRQACDLLAAGRVNTKPCITHEFPLDKINEAFETTLKRDESCKVIVKP